MCTSLLGMLRWRAVLPHLSSKSGQALLFKSSLKGIFTESLSKLDKYLATSNCPVATAICRAAGVCQKKAQNIL